MAFGRDGSDLELEIFDLQLRKLKQALKDIVDISKKTNREIAETTKEEQTKNIVLDAMARILEIETALGKSRSIEW